MEFTDTVVLDGVRTTRDGYAVANARVARTGIQLYRGHEVGKPEMDTVRVFRPEEEVFSGDAMASFAARPLTNDHPTELVSPSTWRQHAVGFTGGEIARDGDHLRVPLMFADQAVIDDIGTGKRELSAGYTCDIDFTPGTTPDGQAYDARQVGIRANHIAVVAKGRAGPTCRIGDSSATEVGMDRQLARRGIERAMRDREAEPTAARDTAYERYVDGVSSGWQASGTRPQQPAQRTAAEQTQDAAETPYDAYRRALSSAWQRVPA